MDIRIALLGPVELRVDDRPCDLGPTSELRVFAALALTPGKPVPVAVLADQVWDGHPPEQAADTLKTYVSRLRKRLEPCCGDQAQIIFGAKSYMLRVNPRAVDLNQFHELWRQARSVVEIGDSNHGATLLKEAEALWASDPLSNLDGQWADGVRIRLAEEKRALVRERIELELQLGRHHELIGELTDLVRRFPTDERLTAMLMTALYRCDRQSDALDAYGRVRERLKSTAGANPGTRLQELYARILRHDEDLAITPVYRRPDQEPQPDTLPPETAHFTGRESELGLLTGGRRRQPERTAYVEVIQGMAGIGKSALATHAARELADRYPDARLFIQLRANDPARPPLQQDEALAELLRMLNVPPARIPKTSRERRSLWQSEMANRRALVILDDAANVEQVRPLIPRTPSCLTFITSRRRIHGLDGMVRTHFLDVLTDSEAAELFTRIAGPDSSRHPKLMKQILHSCGNLPLMIRIEASRTRGRLDPYASEKDHAPFFSEDREQAIPSDVSATLDVAYRRLDLLYRQVYRRLGIQPCDSISTEAVAALVGITIHQAESALGELVDHNFLQESNDGRVAFHDLLHEHARSRAMVEDSEVERRRDFRRLFSYYSLTVSHANELLFPESSHGDHPVLEPGVSPGSISDHRAANSWFDAEWRSILDVAQYAIDHEWQEAGMKLAHAMSEYLDTHAHWREAIRLYTSALRAARELDSEAGIAQALTDLGFMHFRIGDADDAIRRASEALPLYRRSGDRKSEAEALDLIGLVHWTCARYRPALAHIREAHEIYETIDDRRGQADTLNHGGVVCLRLGRYNEAFAQFNQALEMHRAIGDRRGEAKVLNNTGDAYWLQGHHRDAIAYYEASQSIFDEISGEQNRAILAANLGNIYQYRGEYTRALEYYRNALAVHQVTGDRRYQADTLNSMGSAFRLMGKDAESLIHHQKAMNLAKEIGERYELGRAYMGIAEVRREAGQYDDALSHYNEALAIARECGDLHHEGKIYRGIAETLHSRRAKDAKIYWLQALDIFELLDAPEAEEVRIRLEVLDIAAS